jgi:polyhydroxyalkanoate synthesis regulator protein
MQVDVIVVGLGAMGSFGQVASQLEEIGKQNMEMFTQAFSMFNPFAQGAADTTKKK